METHREGGRFAAGVSRSNQLVVETSSHMQWNTTCCRWDPPTQSSDCGDVPRIGRWPSSHNPCCGTRHIVVGVFQHGSQVLMEKAADIVAGDFRGNQLVVEMSSHMQWNTTHCRWDPLMQSSDCGDVPRIGRRPSIQATHVADATLG